MTIIKILIFNIKNLRDLHLVFMAQTVKSLPAMQETWVRSLDWEKPWGREWPLPPAFLPGELHGQRSLAGYGPCSLKELDTTKQLTRFAVFKFLRNIQFISTTILCN